MAILSYSAAGLFGDMIRTSRTSHTRRVKRCIVVSVSGSIQQYQRIYRKLYNRDPKELRDLGSGWVLVNGARMQVTELDKLTEQMFIEYRQAAAQRRNIVTRLLGWFREA